MKNALIVFGVVAFATAILAAQIWADLGVHP